MLYVYIPYLLGTPLNMLFLPYLVLVSFSAYTLAGLMAAIDREAVRQQLDGRVPVRTTAGLFFGLGILTIVRQTAMIVGALTAQTPVDPLERATWIADFTVIPILLVGGTALWRRQPLGYAVGAGLLLGYGV